jgi:hypothetical protein
MYKMSLLAGVTLLGLSGPATAQAQSEANLLALDCPAVASRLNLRPCVYDSRNQRVGLLTSNSYLMRPIGGQWYDFDFDDTGLYTGEFYFTSPDCTGQKYINVGVVESNGVLHTFLPQSGVYDGSVIWGPSGTPAQITVESEGLGPGATCGTYCYGGSCQGPSIVAQSAAVVDKTVFYPPFRVQ